jgi:hypothetical protein
VEPEHHLLPLPQRPPPRPPSHRHGTHARPQRDRLARRGLGLRNLVDYLAKHRRRHHQRHQEKAGEHRVLPEPDQIHVLRRERPRPQPLPRTARLKRERGSLLRLQCETVPENLRASVGTLIVQLVDHPRLPRETGRRPRGLRAACCRCVDARYT